MWQGTSPCPTFEIRLISRRASPCGLPNLLLPAFEGFGTLPPQSLRDFFRTLEMGSLKKYLNEFSDWGFGVKKPFLNIF